MPTAPAMKVQEVTVTSLRDGLKDCLRAARGRVVLHVVNRRQPGGRYIVDKKWFDELVRERQSFLATLEVLADRELTERLLRTAQTVDEDVRAGRLKTIAEVFGV